MKRKISMQQIADAVGVSKFAVSKALAGKEGVSPGTRDKILEAAAQLGYLKQAEPGRRLPGDLQAAEADIAAAGNTKPPAKRTVVVLMPNIRLQTLDSVFWGKIVQGIAVRLESLGYQMVIVTEHTTENFRSVLNPVGVMGLIGVGEISTGMLLEIRQLKLPFVLVDHEDPLVPSDTVFANNLDGAAQITRHMLAQDHRRLVFLGDTRWARSFLDRFVGFRLAVEGVCPGASGPEMTEPVVLEGNDSEEHRKRLLLWLDSWKGRERLRPTALICANDAIALTAAATLRERGILVPESVSITGFDNIDDSLKNDPPLTTVHVPKDKMGERAVDALLDRIRYPDRPAEKILVACQLVIRGSTAPLRP